MFIICMRVVFFLHDSNRIINNLIGITRWDYVRYHEIKNNLSYSIVTKQ